MSTPNYPLRLDSTRRARWQAAADRETRKLADWIKTTCDNAPVVEQTIQELVAEIERLIRVDHMVRDRMVLTNARFEDQGTLFSSARHASGLLAHLRSEGKLP